MLIRQKSYKHICWLCDIKISVCTPTLAPSVSWLLRCGRIWSLNFEWVWMWQLRVVCKALLMFQTYNFHRKHYNVNLTGIEVGGTFLELPPYLFDDGANKGAIVDSGTTLAYLPDAVFKQLLNVVGDHFLLFSISRLLWYPYMCIYIFLLIFQCFFRCSNSIKIWLFVTMGSTYVSGILEGMLSWLAPFDPYYLEVLFLNFLKEVSWIEWLRIKIHAFWVEMANVVFMLFFLMCKAHVFLSFLSKCFVKWRNYLNYII